VSRAAARAAKDVLLLLLLLLLLLPPLPLCAVACTLCRSCNVCCGVAGLWRIDLSTRQFALQVIVPQTSRSKRRFWRDWLSNSG
jgi:hypothetical protein